MTTIDYFKLQAKNLHRDFKSKKPISKNEDSVYLFEYTPKYFDIELIIHDFDVDEKDFSLMKAQHVISQMAGFLKWTNLLKTPESDLKIAKILYENQDIIDLRMWEDYIKNTERMNQSNYDSETKLAICEQVLKMGVFDDGVSFDCYLLHKKY